MKTNTTHSVDLRYTFSKTILLAVLVLMISAVNVMAGKPAPVIDIPITNYLSDYDAGGFPYYVQSDALGAYQNGVNNAVSILVANGYGGIADGDWRLDLLASTRTVAITFSAQNAVQPGDPGYLVPAMPPFWGTQNNSIRTETKCTLDNHNMLTMISGDKFNCTMIIRLSPIGSDAGYYRFEMGWGDPLTQPAQVTCISTDSVGCNEWSIDPIPVVNPDGSTSPGKTRGRLNFIKTQGKTTTTNNGAFYMTFHIHATRP
jgi:hypothetical protein